MGDGPRYEVHSITGYTIDPTKTARVTGGAAVQTTSYSVLDRLYCFREVASFTNSRVRDAIRRAQAESLCARLNAEDEADG